MSSLVTGSFSSRAGAEHAVDELIKAGFAPDHISVLLSEDRPDTEFTVKGGDRGHRIAAIGAGFGSVLGALAGSVALANASPEFPLFAAGPLVVALSGITAGAVAGGLGGAILGHGTPRHVTTFEPGELQGDGVIAGVFVNDDRTLLARSVLDLCGAEQIARK